MPDEEYPHPNPQSYFTDVKHLMCKKCMKTPEI